MIIDAPKPGHRIALRTLWKEAFGDSDKFLDTFEKTAFSPDRCRCISEGDEILAALYWFDCSLHGHRLAYLYAVATAKTHRGKGLCRTLMENTHAHLKTLGYVGVLLVPGESHLFGFYEKLGYRTCSNIGELSCTASAEKTDLRLLSTEEYAALRRKYLPENGVLQDRENIAFLATMATFYAGDDFLLAAECEENSLRGIELLGNTSKAPAILASLDCTDGIFRVPSGNKSFAMYYPLSEATLPAPIHFGLAFD